MTALSEEYGWEGLDARIPLRCFAFEPSVKSSLKFLRRTPWAREKVESLYLFMLRERQRRARGGGWVALASGTPEAEARLREFVDGKAKKLQDSQA